MKSKFTDEENSSVPSACARCGAFYLNYTPCEPKALAFALRASLRLAQRSRSKRRAPRWKACFPTRLTCLSAPPLRDGAGAVKSLPLR